MVHLLRYSLLSNIASQLEETGPLNSSCSKACTVELTQFPLFPLFQLASNSKSFFNCTQSQKSYFLTWVPLIFASKTWCLNDVNG